MIINLNDIILKPFRKIVNNCLNNKYHRLILKGGRCSTKSTIGAIIVVLRTKLIRHSAMCIVRYAVAVSDRLDNQIILAMDLLGVRDQFRYIKNRHEFIYLDKNGKDTDIVIYCRGADDPQRLKSFKDKTGFFSTLWIEEATNFDNLQSIIDIESSIGRGGGHLFCCLISYNPRQSSHDFLNNEYEYVKSTDKLLNSFRDDKTLFSYREEQTDIEINDNIMTVIQCVVHCTYKTVIEEGHTEWIPISDLQRIQVGEKENSDFYRWYYLGDTHGTSTISVFRNIVKYKFNKELLNNKTDRGIDFSNGGSDPYHVGSWWYDKANNDLYCLGEIRLPGSAGMTDLSSNIKMKIGGNYLYYTDSAVPEFTKQLNSAGIRAYGAKKGPDSKYAGIFWLKSLNHIYIDPDFTPFTYKEFASYEYKRDRKTEEILPEIPDGNDHSIDCCRYAEYINIQDASFVRRGGTN